MTLCLVRDCPRPQHAKGWCLRHAAQIRRHGSVLPVSQLRDHRPFADRFMDRVQVTPTGCWRWTGATDPKGYAKARVSGVTFAVHRWVYEHLRGPVPEGMALDHRCHSTSECPGGICSHRRCVNPDHLEPVTVQENNRRRWQGASA